MMAEKGKSALKALAAARNGKSGGEPANWGDASAEAVLDCIAWGAALGGAIRFGYTRDGGAYAVGLYLDDEHETLYIKPSDDIDQWLRDMAEDLKATYNARQQR